MSRLIGSSLVLLSFLVGHFSQASTLEEIKTQLQSTPYLAEKPVDNDLIFLKYCVGNPNSADVPKPNYSNELVIEAAKKLTESKTVANGRLAELAKEEFNLILEQIKEKLRSIIASSKDKVVMQNAQNFLNEVSGPAVISISPAAANNFKAMSKIVLEQLKKELQLVAPSLNKELKGIDLVLFSKLANDLNKYAKAELKSTDLQNFKNVFQQMYSVLNSKIPTIDSKKLNSTSEQVLLWTVAGDNSDEYVKYAQGVAQQLVDVFKKSSSVKPEELDHVFYLISELNYYAKELEAISYKGADFDAIKKVLVLENTKITIINMAKSADELNEYLKDLQKNKNEIANAAEYLSYAIKDNMNDGAIKVFEGSDEALAKSFVALTKGFSNEGIISNTQSVIDYLHQKTEAGNLSAFSTAESLMYSLQLAENVSPEFVRVMADILTQLSNQKTQNILSEINSIDSELQSSTEVSQDFSSKLNDLKYSLQQPLLVSLATQVLVDNLNAVIESTSAVVDLSSNMSAVLAEAKQADHFYFYGGVRRLYKLSETVPAEAVSAGANKEAHWFITQLCGEFRDRATMIEAKLKWIQNMNILAKSATSVIDPATLSQAKNVWMRITAKAYYPYIYVASSVWEARREAQERYIQIGTITDIDNPVAGLTVCETKYVFEKYVAQDKTFDDLESYDKNYEAYKGSCPVTDLTDYYDFRGDSNFKHYSPESNGMIWQATSLARGCTSATKANSGIYTDDDCKNYFERPFATRYNAARAGLATWLFRDEKHSDVFSSQGQMVAIYPHKEPALAPFSFGFSETSTEGALFDYNPKWLGVPNAWNSSDIGFNGFTGLGTADADQEQAYVLIRDAVDRHTDWYSSGYNDGNGTTKNQAYSPFVASSYVMQSSDGFTSCGATVQCPPDGLKRWMFVFRIKAQNWYTPARIQNNEPIDFNKMWFDETSFGVSSLANSEHAWDRLGTAQEEEFASILYLVNVAGENSGEFEGDFEEEPDPGHE